MITSPKWLPLAAAIKYSDPDGRTWYAWTESVGVANAICVTPSPGGGWDCVTLPRGIRADHLRDHLRAIGMDANRDPDRVRWVKVKREEAIRWHSASIAREVA